MEILIGVAAFIILLILIICIGYVKAPPDTAYMISGFRKPRILIGKAGIRIPFLERLDKLSLKMFSVDVKTTDFVPNAEYINVKVDATVKIRIGQSEEMMSLASKFFLNESEDKVVVDLHTPRLDRTVYRHCAAAAEHINESAIAFRSQFIEYPQQLALASHPGDEAFQSVSPPSRGKVI